MTPANLENLGLRQLDSSGDGHGFRSLVPLSIKSGGEDETPIFRHANRCRKLAAAFAHGYITLPTVPLFNLRGGDFTLGVFVKAGPGNLNWFTKGNSLGNNMGEHRYGLGGGKTISFSFEAVRAATLTIPPSCSTSYGTTSQASSVAPRPRSGSTDEEKTSRRSRAARRKEVSASSAWAHAADPSTAKWQTQKSGTVPLAVKKSQLKHSNPREGK